MLLWADDHHDGGDHFLHRIVMLFGGRWKLKTRFSNFRFFRLDEACRNGIEFRKSRSGNSILDPREKVFGRRLTLLQSVVSDEGLRIIRDGSHPDHSGHMSRQLKKSKFKNQLTFHWFMDTSR